MKAPEVKNEIAQPVRPGTLTGELLPPVEKPAESAPAAPTPDAPEAIVVTPAESQAPTPDATDEPLEETSSKAPETKEEEKPAEVKAYKGAPSDWELSDAGKGQILARNRLNGDRYEGTIKGFNELFKG